MKRFIELVAALALVAAWLCLTIDPVRAQTPYLTGQDAPDYVGVAYNAFGDRILLMSNHCNDPDTRMRMYKIVDKRGNLLTGGCWQWDHEQIHKTGIIHYFSLNGGGWDTWPLSAFHKPIYPKQ